MFYPLSGFMADVCCKQLKTIMISLCSLLLFVFMVCFAGVLFLVFKMYKAKNVLELLQSKSQAGNLINTHNTAYFVVIFCRWSGRLSSQLHSSWVRSTFWSTRSPFRTLYSLHFVVISSWSHTIGSISSRLVQSSKTCCTSSTRFRTCNCDSYVDCIGCNNEMEETLVLHWNCTGKSLQTCLQGDWLC